MKSQTGGNMLYIIILTKSHHKINKLIKYLLTAFYVPKLNYLYELIYFLPQSYKVGIIIIPMLKVKKNKAKNI